MYELVHREARGERRQIDRCAALEERAQRRAACYASAVLLKRRPRPSLARAHERCLGNPGHVQSSLRHGLHLWPHLSIAPLDPLSVKLELEELPRVFGRRHGHGTARLARM